MMFNRIDSTRYVDVLRKWVEQCPRAMAEFHRRNATGWHTWKNSEFKRWLFAFSKRADIATPVGRRLVRRYMDMQSLQKYFSDEDRWLVSENYDDEPDALPEDTKEDEPISADVQKCLEWFLDSPAIDDPYYVSSNLLKCQNPPEAVRWSRSVFPFLKSGTRAYDYLACVGYPIGVPHTAVRQMMTRLGWNAARDPRGEIVSEEQYQDYIAKLAAGTSDSPASISLLFSLQAGQEAWRNFSIGGACHKVHPECDTCVLKSYCEYAKTRADDEVNSEKKNRKNSGNGLMIRDMSDAEKPREKLLRNGAKSLRDDELLAVILRTGLPDCSAIDLANRIIKSFGSLSRAQNAGIGELMQIPGIKEAKAAQIVAALELGKRSKKQFNEERILNTESLSDPGKIYEVYFSKYYDEVQEIFVVLLLDVKLHCFREFEVSRGTVSKTAVSPREVFRVAIREAAYAIICLHNHPSGNPEPSAEDRKMTRALFETGEAVGIQLLDHVILGRDNYYSFQEHDALEG